MFYKIFVKVNGMIKGVYLIYCLTHRKYPTNFFITIILNYSLVYISIYFNTHFRSESSCWHLKLHDLGLIAGYGLKVTSAPGTPQFL